MENLHERIKEARDIAGLTQSELAEKSGVKLRQIARYEAGDANPRNRVLIKIAEATGMTVDWLRGGGEYEFYLDRLLRPDLLDHCLAEAKKNGVSVNEYINSLIQQSLENDAIK